VSGQPRSFRNQAASSRCQHQPSVSTRLLLPSTLQAAKVAPKDPDLRKKLAECERAVKRIRFEEALATPVSHCVCCRHGVATAGGLTTGHSAVSAVGPSHPSTPVPLTRQDSEVTHVSDTIDLDSMLVEESYKGPRMQGGCDWEENSSSLLMCVLPWLSMPP
jgi:hypothetical protein